jgi:transposase-like protein
LRGVAIFAKACFGHPSPSKKEGVNVDNATLNRWVISYSPTIAVKATSQKRETNRSWRMDETYIKVKGEWGYLYREVDSHGDTLDFMLSERCFTYKNQNTSTDRTKHLFQFLQSLLERSETL